MTDTTEEARTARRARHEAILAEVAQEEAEAVEAEVAEKASTLDMPLHLRIDRGADALLDVTTLGYDYASESTNVSPGT